MIASCLRERETIYAGFDLRVFGCDRALSVLRSRIRGMWSKANLMYEGWNS